MITVDKRAGSEALYKPLRKFMRPAGVKVVKGTLDSADVAWDGYNWQSPGHGVLRYGVEVKHLPDVLQCIADGRFVDQLRRMQRQYDVYYLLIVDDFKAQSDGELTYKKVFGKFASSWFRPYASRRGNAISYAGLQGWISTMVHEGGCYYDHVQDDKQAVQWLACKYGWGQKKKHDSLNVFGTTRPAPRRNKSGVRFVGKPNKVAYVANALVDGIGWEKAKALSYEFDSPWELITATEKEILARMKGKGVGKVLAQDIAAEARKSVRGKK